MQRIILSISILISSLALIGQSDGSVSITLTVPDAVEPATIVYLVRHAEKQISSGEMMSKDPDLTAPGVARAKDLARLLQDAGIQYVYSSDYKRTRNTAQPIADLLGLEVQIYDPRKSEELVQQIQSNAGRYLVVGHSNSTPNLVKLLGGEAGEPIDDATEYDRLYTMVLQDGVAPVTLRTRYGDLSSKEVAANTDDVSSIEHIIKAAFESISGPAGTPRDWDRFRSLFLPTAQFITAINNAETGKKENIVKGLEDYIATSGPWLEKNDFFEWEVKRIEEKFSHVAHVFSTYEARKKPTDKKAFNRGMSSLQLFFDNDRWWIVNWMWTGETDEVKLPKKYLPR